MRVTKLEIKKGLLISLAAAIALSLTGCAKKSDCEEKEYHLHRYEKGKLVRYLPREELNYQGYQWTEDVYFTDPDFFEYADRQGLLEINENKEYIQEVQNSQKDYLEYEYEYMMLMPMGKTLFPMFFTDWTTDPNHDSLTGKVQNCHPMYVAYKVETDEKGKRKLIQSPLVDNILEIEEEYPMFRENFTVIVKSDVKEDAKTYQLNK